MSIFDILQLAGYLILAVGYIPQIVQIIRTKSCADLNLKTYTMMSVGIGMMEIYAVHLALGAPVRCFWPPIAFPCVWLC